MILLRKALKILAHLAAIAVLYLALATAMWLGLQVSPVYGSVAFVVFIALVVLYIRFGFMRKK